MTHAPIQRVAAWGLALFVFAAVSNLVIGAFAWDYFDKRRSREDFELRLEELQAKRPNLATLRVSLAEFRENNVGTLFYAEMEIEEAQGLFAKRWRDISAAAGPIDTSAQPFPLLQQAALTSVGLTVQLQISADQIGELVAAIESSSPLILVDDVKIASASSRNVEGSLDVAMTIKSYAAPPTRDQ